jgi:hypothetical protein
VVVRVDVPALVVRVEHGLDLVRVLDSVRVLADLLARVAFCPDLAKVPLLVALLDVQRHAAVATSATRRPKKAR